MPIAKGNEPLNVTTKLYNLLNDLKATYPDGVVRNLQRDHKKWAEKVTFLYRELGYPNGDSFLNAYGFTVERNITGRPKSNDYSAIIEELKKRYPDGPKFSKVSDLEKANPDLAPSLKTMANNATELFGTSFKDYLKKIGILKGSSGSIDDIIAELKKRYSDKKPPETINELISDNKDIVNTGFCNLVAKQCGETAANFLQKFGLLC